jgi:hypothetical protein
MLTVLMLKVGQTIYMQCIILAGKSPNIRSYMVYIYGSGQPYSCSSATLNAVRAYTRAFWPFELHVHACEHACVHACACVCVHARVYTYACTCMHVCACMHVCTHAYICRCMRRKAPAYIAAPPQKTPLLLMPEVSLASGLFFAAAAASCSAFAALSFPTPYNLLSAYWA